MSISSKLHNHLTDFHNYTDEELKTLSHQLSTWYTANRRKLPWRGDKPPYTTYNDATTKISQQITKSKGQKTLTSFFSSQPDKQKLVKSVQSKINEITSENTHDSNSIDLTITPYHIWVSEVMLQQTRVDTVIPKYLLWMKTFPTIEALAQATDDEVQSIWSGLGYYRRARLLHNGAKLVVKDFNGKLPSTCEELLKIPGIGKYTAGAISSIAFNNPDPLVDGNVLRLFSRHRFIITSPSSSSFNDYTWEIAERIVKYDTPSIVNQSLMEIGALLCTPKSPKCTSCPIASSCLSRQYFTDEVETNTLTQEDLHQCLLCTKLPDLLTIDSIPLKKEKAQLQEQYLQILVFYDKNSDSYLLKKKTEKGVLEGKLEPFYMMLHDHNNLESVLSELYDSAYVISRHMNISKCDCIYVDDIIHTFSHIRHHLSIFKCETYRDNIKIDDYDWYTQEDILKHGYTTWLKKILETVQESNSNLNYKTKRTKKQTNKTITLEYESDDISSE